MKLSIVQIILGLITSVMGGVTIQLPVGMTFIILGLLVLGVGIAQLTKARKLG